VKVENLMRFCVAGHYTYMVESPFTQRGGILLVAGPQSMKSTIVKCALLNLPNCLVYSDLTLKQLAVVRSQIANGTYHTLGFLELEKIYARQPTVAMNFEGVLKAMVEEGFSHFAFEDQRIWVPTAKCFVLASVLDSLYLQHGGRWISNGFLRRFLVIKYRLTQASRLKMMEAIHENELIPMPPGFLIPTTAIPMQVSKEESRHLQSLLQDDSSTPLNLLRKILTILKWHYKMNGRRREPTPMELIEDLASSIGPLGGELEL
jgi:hypothetical protein